MKATSTSQRAKNKLLRLGGVLFWLLIWQLGSMAVDQEILLAVSYTHLDVYKRQA